MTTATKTTRDLIVQQRFEYPLETLKEIGLAFGVTAQYVHKVLRAENVPTRRPERKSFRYCVLEKCQEKIENSMAKVHAGRCHAEYYWLYVRCNNCWAEWHMRRGQMKQKVDRGDKNIYCSRDCYFEHRFKSKQNLI